MMNQLQPQYLPVRTKMKAGVWWASACLDEHSNSYECCVAGATPSTCKSCVETCVEANRGPDFDTESYHRCILNAKCMG